MIRQRENKLFKIWSKGIVDFSSDGVVNESNYHSSNLKLLFLLKETNGTEGHFDLRAFLANCDRKHTWDNVARWVFGIRNIHRDVNWGELENISDDQRRQLLKSIVAVNLKKAPGGHTTNNKLFMEAVEKDRAYLKEQISLYDADLIILCGSIVASGFDLIYENSFDGLWKKTSRGIGYVEFGKGKYAISYAHPEARVQDCLLFYGLVDAVREVLPDAVRTI
jgi:hypothetical protein